MPDSHTFELICKNYFDKLNTREINYVRFCHDVDKSNEKEDKSKNSNDAAA